jgi:hypothetical protein
VNESDQTIDLVAPLGNSVIYRSIDLFVHPFIHPSVRLYLYLYLLSKSNQICLNQCKSIYVILPAGRAQRPTRGHFILIEG